MDTELKPSAGKTAEKLKNKLKEFKYPLLVLALGGLLLLFPFGKNRQSQPKEPEQVLPAEEKQESFAEQTERRLEEILSQIDGAGSVRVMLTVQGSDVTFYQTDTDHSTDEQEGSSRTSTQYKTVILSGAGEYDKAAVVKTEYPPFQGALILSRGADDAAVRLALVDAVSALIGLGTDKISVVKMK